MFVGTTVMQSSTSVCRDCHRWSLTICAQALEGARAAHVARKGDRTPGGVHRRSRSDNWAEMPGAGGSGSDSQRERRLRQRQREGGGGASASSGSVGRGGATGSGSGADPATTRAGAGGGGGGSRGTPVPADRQGAPKRRAAPTPGHHQPPGQWRAEDAEDWIARGVSAETIPSITDVLAVTHDRRWPSTIRRMGGWTCVVVPCFASLADEMEQHLVAVGAVAPGGGAPPEEAHPAVVEDSDSFTSESD